MVPIAAGLSTATIVAGLYMNTATDDNPDNGPISNIFCKSILAEEKYKNAGEALTIHHRSNIRQDLGRRKYLKLC